MKIVFATQTCSVGQTLVREGSHWPADDPLVVDNPGLFTDDPAFGLSYTREPRTEARVEQATAAPGERRR